MPGRIRKPSLENFVCAFLLPLLNAFPAHAFKARNSRRASPSLGTPEELFPAAATQSAIRRWTHPNRSRQNVYDAGHGQIDTTLEEHDHSSRFGSRPEFGHPGEITLNHSPLRIVARLPGIVTFAFFAYHRAQNGVQAQPIASIQLGRVASNLKPHPLLSIVAIITVGGSPALASSNLHPYSLGPWVWVLGPDKSLDE